MDKTRILVSDDDPVMRVLLNKTLVARNYDVQICCDGFEAWDQLQNGASPRIAILDWMMGDLDGLELCRRIRASEQLRSLYVILITARGGKRNVVAGLAAGADDFLVKPIDLDELHARLQVGERILGLQQSLAERVSELEAALSNVKQLHGLLPICAYCKNIRDDRNYWQKVENYVAGHSEARFSHGICPECRNRYVEPMLAEVRGTRSRS